MGEARILYVGGRKKPEEFELVSERSRRRENLGTRRKKGTEKGIGTVSP